MPLTEQELQRYGRQLVMPEIGEEGQEKLKSSRVLVVGTGGLGSPAAFYLAAAGIGTLGLLDSDRVELSNLQRQILHGEPTLGKNKVDSAQHTLENLNPYIKVETHHLRIDVDNVEDIISRYQVIVDGCDNFRTRYLINDACVIHRRPFVYGSVMRFEGQASVFFPPASGCYRCLFKEPPPPGAVPSCQETGVVGIAPGLIGIVEATETIKLLLETGSSLLNRLLIFDGLEMSFMDVNYNQDPLCPVCGKEPSITSIEDENYPPNSI